MDRRGERQSLLDSCLSVLKKHPLAEIEPGDGMDADQLREASSLAEAPVANKEIKNVRVTQSVPDLPPSRKKSMLSKNTVLLQSVQVPPNPPRESRGSAISLGSRRSMPKSKGSPPLSDLSSQSSAIFSFGSSSGSNALERAEAILRRPEVDPEPEYKSDSSTGRRRPNLSKSHAIQARDNSDRSETSASLSSPSSLPHIPREESQDLRAKYGFQPRLKSLLKTQTPDSLDPTFELITDHGDDTETKRGARSGSSYQHKSFAGPKRSPEEPASHGSAPPSGGSSSAASALEKAEAILRRPEVDPEPEYKSDSSSGRRRPNLSRKHDIQARDNSDRSVTSVSLSSPSSLPHIPREESQDLRAKYGFQPRLKSLLKTQIPDSLDPTFELITDHGDDAEKKLGVRSGSSYQQKPFAGPKRIPEEPASHVSAPPSGGSSSAASALEKAEAILRRPEVDPEPEYKSDSSSGRLRPNLSKKHAIPARDNSDRSETSSSLSSPSSLPRIPREESQDLRAKYGFQPRLKSLLTTQIPDSLDPTFELITDHGDDTETKRGSRSALSYQHKTFPGPKRSPEESASHGSAPPSGGSSSAASALENAEAILRRPEVDPDSEYTSESSVSSRRSIQCMLKKPRTQVDPGSRQALQGLLKTIPCTQVDPSSRDGLQATLKKPYFSQMDPSLRDSLQALLKKSPCTQIDPSSHDGLQTTLRRPEVDPEPVYKSDSNSSSRRSIQALLKKPCTQVVPGSRQALQGLLKKPPCTQIDPSSHYGLQATLRRPKVDPESVYKSDSNSSSRRSIQALLKKHSCTQVDPGSRQALQGLLKKPPCTQIDPRSRHGLQALLKKPPCTQIDPSSHAGLQALLKKPPSTQENETGHYSDRSESSSISPPSSLTPIPGDENKGLRPKYGLQFQPTRNDLPNPNMESCSESLTSLQSERSGVVSLSHHNPPVSYQHDREPASNSSTLFSNEQPSSAKSSKTGKAGIRKEFKLKTTDSGRKNRATLKNESPSEFSTKSSTSVSFEEEKSKGIRGSPVANVQIKSLQSHTKTSSPKSFSESLLSDSLQPVSELLSDHEDTLTNIKTERSLVLTSPPSVSLESQPGSILTSQKSSIHTKRSSVGSKSHATTPAVSNHEKSAGKTDSSTGCESNEEQGKSELKTNSSGLESNQQQGMSVSKTESIGLESEDGEDTAHSYAQSAGNDSVEGTLGGANGNTSPVSAMASSKSSVSIDNREGADFESMLETEFRTITDNLKVVTSTGSSVPYAEDFLSELAESRLESKKKNGEPSARPIYPVHVPNLELPPFPSLPAYYPSYYPPGMERKTEDVVPSTVYYGQPYYDQWGQVMDRGNERETIPFYVGPTQRFVSQVLSTNAAVLASALTAAQEMGRFHRDIVAGATGTGTGKDKKKRKRDNPPPAADDDQA